MSRILIIDDDDSIRESLDMYLTEEGYDVEVADNGWVGISKYAASRAELVILDIRLPDVSGLFVYDELRKQDHQAKVIMITAFHDENTIDEAIKKGVFKYIKKPIDMNVLDKAIVEALEQ
ncbi:MAG: response regulator [Syntrophales bacterium]|jgi:two-component system response regulator AtoC